MNTDEIIERYNNGEYEEFFSEFDKKAFWLALICLALFDIKVWITLIKMVVMFG